MSFSSYSFVFLFFPMLIILFNIGRFHSTKTEMLYKKIILLVTSGVFIASISMKALLVCICSGIMNYLLSKIMMRMHNRYLLYAGALANVAILAGYKYIGAGLLLPVGLSFYTFQQLIYLQGIWETGKTVPEFMDYLLYILFFPKFISGPIVKFDGAYLGLQPKQPSDAVYRNIAAGFYLFCIGLFKKVVIADTLAQFVNTGYGMVLKIDCLQAWVTALCFTFQLYFDFSGYSDMAVGIARTLGISLPYNFKSPYHAESIKDFWNKWHITLGETLAKLVYYPLGGNRRGKARTCINKMIVFLLSGIWHGYGLGFVLWGGLHGLFSVLEIWFGNLLVRVPRIVKCFGTFCIVNLLWVLFRAGNIKNAILMYRAMLGIGNGSIASLGVLANDGIIPFPDAIWGIYLLGILFIVIIIIMQKKNSVWLYENFQPDRKNICFTVFLFCVSTIHMSRLSIFVYQNF